MKKSIHVHCAVVLAQPPASSSTFFLSMKLLFHLRVVYIQPEIEGLLCVSPWMNKADRLSVPSNFLGVQSPQQTEQWRWRCMCSEAVSLLFQSRSSQHWNVLRNLCQGLLIAFLKSPKVYELHTDFEYNLTHNVCLWLYPAIILHPVPWRASGEEVNVSQSTDCWGEAILITVTTTGTAKAFHVRLWPER